MRRSLPPQIQDVIPIVVVIRSSSLSCHNLDEFVEKYVSEDAPCIPHSLFSATSPKILYEILTLACQIRCLAHFFFNIIFTGLCRFSYRTSLTKHSFTVGTLIRGCHHGDKDQEAKDINQRMQGLLLGSRNSVFPAPFGWCSCSMMSRMQLLV